MPDPINPKLSDDELVKQILRHYPSLTLDEIVEHLAAFGCDVSISPELRRKLQRERLHPQ